MPKNALYNVITAAIFNQSTAVLPDGVTLSKCKNNKGANYFLFELSPDNGFAIDNLTLKNHHLSVYENPLSSVDKSQYHYTAVFEDGESREYRLHVYFNYRDYCLWEPKLSLILPENKFVPVESKEHSDAFRTLAHIATNKLIDYLRATQNTVISNLQRGNESLEAQASLLSKKLDDNRAEYIACIRRLIDAHEELKKYVNNVQPVLSTVRYYKNLCDQLSLITESPIIATRIEENKAEPSATILLSDAKSDISDLKSEGTNTRVKKRSILDEVIKNLKERFLAYNEATEEQKPSLLVACFNELILYEMDVEDIGDFALLKLDIEEEGKKLLELFLIKKQYEKAEKLAPFYYLLTDNIFHLAMRRSPEDVGLLSFLLKNQIIPFDYKNFVIKEVSYSSLMAYYFEADISTPAKINSLDVLIKNGVSLMTLDKSGLPFAATLLSQPGHPLRPILERNAELTLDNPVFYKQLNSVLRVLASQSTCSKERKAQLTELIVSTNAALEAVSRKREISRLSHLPKAELNGGILKSDKARGLIDRLKLDPDIAGLEKTIQQKVITILKASKANRPKTKKSLGCIAQVNLDKYQEQLVNIDEHQLPTFERLKELFLTQQRNVIHFLELWDNLKDITTQGSRRISAKERNAIKGRQQQIINELGALTKKLYLPLQDLLKQDVLKSIDELEKTSSELAKTRERLEKTRNELARIREGIEKARNELAKTKEGIEKVKEEKKESEKQQVNAARASQSGLFASSDKPGSDAQSAIPQAGP
ncbi:coiled-coil domain-containing protein [Legionella fallonii]|uniref:Coiled-coil-containing protein n=1 Tax=Legionella fallonii LLAP-10 TaxID=1212491 RepID=A0A098G830_9GAMM|nr:hypothetical protein [Legionella fallonii]CEG58628.1 protein of unknown function [Legionella fallonii LLAP-10]